MEAAARTCADIDGDGTANDAFSCPSTGSAALSGSPGDISCGGSECTASECCTVCADDSVWAHSALGVSYDCAAFVAAEALGLGPTKCEESWATGTDASGATVTAYEACRVSCPVSSTIARACTAPVEADATQDESAPDSSTPQPDAEEESTTQDPVPTVEETPTGEPAPQETAPEACACTTCIGAQRDTGMSEEEALEDCSSRQDCSCYTPECACDTCVVAQMADGMERAVALADCGTRSDCSCHEPCTCDDCVYINSHEVSHCESVLFHDCTCFVEEACTSSPCQNEGVCANFDGSPQSAGRYECSCSGGWTGTNCETPPMCSSTPCKNDATCTDIVNPTPRYDCDCTATGGWSGVNCEDEPACASSPCQNSGECTSSLEPATCAADNTCASTGEQVKGVFSCVCFDGFGGGMCELERACDSSPCQHAGVCESLSLSEGGREFTCTCVDGWSGSSCEEAACVSSPCLNSGNCTDAVSETDAPIFSCECVDGWSGEVCDVPPACASSPCSHGGACADRLIDDAPAFTCTCIDGWHGRVVSGSGVVTQELSHEQAEECSDVGACASSPCTTNGTCLDALVTDEARPSDEFGNTTLYSGPVYTCSCLDGWSGELCEVEPACISSPCGNTADCINDLADGQPFFTCVCTPGWVGSTCASAVKIISVLTLNKDASEIGSPSADRRFRDAFVRDICGLLGVPARRISFISVVGGSVIVTFEILPATAGSGDPAPGALYASLQTKHNSTTGIILAGAGVVALTTREPEVQVIITPGADGADSGRGSAGSGWLGALATGDDGFNWEQGGLVFFGLGVPGLCIVCCCCYGVCCKKTGFEKWSTDKASLKRFCTPRCSKEDCNDAAYKVKSKCGCIKKKPVPGSLEAIDDDDDDDGDGLEAGRPRGAGDDGGAGAAGGGGGGAATMASMRAQVRSEMQKSVASMREADGVTTARKSMGGVVRGLPRDATSAMDDLSKVASPKGVRSSMMKHAARRSMRP